MEIELTTNEIMIGIDELDTIAEGTDNLKDFLEGASEKYPNFDELKIMIVEWLDICDPDHKDYFLNVIDTAAESMAKGDIKNLLWKHADKSDKPAHYKNTLSQQIYKKAREFGIIMRPLDFISAIIQYDPRVKEKQAMACQQPEETAEEKKKRGKRGKSEKREEKVEWRKPTKQEKADAKEVLSREEAKERHQEEEREIDRISGKVSKAEDVESLRKLLSDVSQYLKNHELSARALMREIERKIASISRRTIGSVSTAGELDLKSRILKDLSAGTLDVSQAINDIEQAAQKACESIAGDNERRAKLGVRITPIAYKSKILMDIITEIKTKYPIAEGKEGEAIQQLVQLGASLQQATGSIVENLINTQNYQRARDIIEQYPQTERNAKKDKFDSEATRRVVEKWEEKLRNGPKETSVPQVVVNEK